MKEDQELIHEILSSRRTSAFGMLVKKYQSSVFTICMRILKNRETSEEVAQDVFVKCFRDLQQLKDANKFRNWLMRIAYTKSIDKMRLKSSSFTELNETILNTKSDDFTPFVQMSQLNRRDIIKQCINLLDKDQAIIINLFYLEDLAIVDIGEIMGMSESNVKVILYRARKNLKEIIPVEIANSIYD